MNIKPVCLLLLIFVIPSLSLSDSTPVSKDAVELSIDKHAQLLLSDTTVNAISVGVYNRGKTYINHYGELERGKGNRPTNETIYEIGSVSKTFAGTLVAQAELEGKLDLEDDIREYLNEDLPNFQYEGHPIRIKDLITHTSRLPKFLPKTINTILENPTDSSAFEIHEIEKEYSRTSFFNDLREVLLDTIPGTRFGYSSVDTELMAHILENIYDKSYNELIQEKIGNKLGLKHTGTSLQTADKENLATGYTTNNVVAPHMTSSLWSAGGGITSTLPDLMKYAQFQLDKTNPVSMRSHELVYENGGDRIAYYWPVRYDEENGTYYSHHGGAFGMQNYLFVFPDKDLAISVVTNQSIDGTANRLLALAGGILSDLK